MEHSVWCRHDDLPRRIRRCIATSVPLGDAGYDAAEQIWRNCLKGVGSGLDHVAIMVFGSISAELC